MYGKGKCGKVFNDRSYLNIELKRTSMHSQIVKDMLQITKLQNDARLYCKWEAFKEFIISCTNKFFLLNECLPNAPRNIVQVKNGSIKNALVNLKVSTENIEHLKRRCYNLFINVL